MDKTIPHFRVSQKVKDIDQSTKNLVSGYLRIFNSESIIPIEICYICLLFYYIVPEYFVVYGEGIKIISSDDNNGRIDNIVQMSKKAPWFEWISVKGNVIINHTMDH